MSVINDLVNEALSRWVILTKTNPKNRKISFGDDWSPYDLVKHLETLNASRTLDPTGLTTFMLLRGLLDKYLAEVKVSAKEIILDFASVDAETRPMRELHEILERPEVVELVGDFCSKIGKTADAYGVRGKKREDLDRLLKSGWALATVRRDALRSMETLEAHQFCQGAGSEAPLKLNRKVAEFWNVGALVRAAMSQKVDGVTLSVIRDNEVELASFFVLCVRNGETVSVLTDRDLGAHPDFKRMGRSLGRNLESRAERHWFPYWLLDVEGDGKKMYARSRKQLALRGAEAVALCEISDLGAEEFVWLVLVSELLLDAYWKENKKLPELSYTAEMVREPYALVGKESALVREGRYRPLELPALTTADVVALAGSTQWERKSVGWNSWATERYASQVPVSFYNAVGQSEAKALLPVKFGDGLDLAPVKDVFGELEKGPGELRGLDSLAFGRSKEIERDRLWAARFNQSAAVNKLVEAEFVKEKLATMEWARSALPKNRAMLLEGLVRMELSLPWARWSSSASGEEWGEREVFPSVDRLLRKVKNCMEVGVGSSPRKAFPGFYWSTLDTAPCPECKGKHKKTCRLECNWNANVSVGILGIGSVEWSRGGGEFYRCGRCEEAGSTVFGRVRPTCPEALGVLFGVKVSEMPFGLQHFWGGSRGEPYTGNSILDRVDPEEWKIENPWNELDLDVRLCMCRRCFHGFRKDLGLPRFEVSTLKKEEKD